ncbi:NAD(P)/FAD-dependent oxidoreductase [Devosia sp.]|uniref:NAD(P)/FAD-dependent oxidoreductase n=1 Tax=Devosia sp. TaxID=1871048 RepID=UPI002AFFBA45|nr:FAD-dependent oxidoreductase [Devosia sp.]
MEQFDVVVLGQGYAGLKAAELAAASGLRTASFEGAMAGGLVMSINELDPVPGGVATSGAELTGAMAMANMDGGVETKFAAASGLRRDGEGWIVTSEEGDCRAANVILATGARLRKLGVPGEAELAGRGVSECADCDGPLYQGKDGVIVGGGDSAFQEALALAHYAANVTIVMRGESPRARADLVAAVAAAANICVLPQTEVSAILGDAQAGVTGVRLRDAAGERVLDCASVFVFIGLEAQSQLLPGEAGRDAAGAVLTSQTCATDLPGLWAIGAVRSGFGGLLSDAGDDAARVIAALS